MQRYRVTVVVITVLSLHALALAAPRPNAPTRAEAPTSWDANTERLFGKAPTDLVRGERPKVGIGSRPTVGTPNGGPVAPTGGTGKFAWSQIISAEGVADEIKSFRLPVSESVKNPGAFRSGGNNKLRTNYAVIAVMFGIAAEFDGKVRWQEIAPGARDAFARAARNAKAVDSNAFNESKMRSQDLDELIRGGSVDFDAPMEDPAWSEVAARRALMIRLEEAEKIRIRPWTASEAQFQRNLDNVAHEARVIAALAEVIQRKDYEFYDDEDYLTFCKQMQRHALAVAQAAKDKNLTEVQRAVGELTKTCSACHEGYR